ncbi:unnamed protein product, partial [marine sediment metagenome]
LNPHFFRFKFLRFNYFWFFLVCFSSRFFICRALRYHISISDQVVV